MEPGPSLENLIPNIEAEGSHTSSSDRGKSVSSKGTSRASSKATSRGSSLTAKEDSSPDASTIGQSVPLDLDQSRFFESF